MGWTGLDQWAYAGRKSLQAVWDFTTVRWIGFYLHPAPNYRPPSNAKQQWMPVGFEDSVHQALEQIGYAVVPIFVGEQLPGVQYSSSNISKTKGDDDGKLAVRAASMASFKEGTLIYLDIENTKVAPGAKTKTSLSDYVSAWSDQVTAGGFVPAIYCGIGVADLVASITPPAPGTQFWVAHYLSSGTTVGSALPEEDISSSGFAAATTWQFIQSANVKFPIGKNTFVLPNHDINTSLYQNPADPSAPDVWKFSVIYP